MGGWWGFEEGRGKEKLGNGTVRKGQGNGEWNG